MTGRCRGNIAPATSLTGVCVSALSPMLHLHVLEIMSVHLILPGKKLTVKELFLLIAGNRRLLLYSSVNIRRLSKVLPSSVASCSCPSVLRLKNHVAAVQASRLLREWTQQDEGVQV